MPLDPPLRVAVEVWGADLSTIVDTCLRAEAQGLDAFYYGESPGPTNLDCWTVLAHLAAHTKGIRLGPVITNVLPIHRSTLLLAKQAATVAITSGGRLDLRTGIGADRPYGRDWWAPFGIEYGDHRARAADLAAALEALPGLWAHPSEGIGGLGLSHPPIPVTIAATAPAGIELAHRHADWWEVSHTTADELRTLVADHACPTSVCPLAVSVEVDGLIAPTEAGVDATVGRFRADRRSEDVDGLVARALVGTPATVVDQMEALRQAGARQVLVALHDPHDAGALDALAEARRLLVDDR